MDLYCVKKCSKCIFDESRDDFPIKVLHMLNEGEHVDLIVKETTIFFLLKGELLLSYNNRIEEKFRAGEMILFSTIHTANITVIEEAYGISCTLESQVQICGKFSLEPLIPFPRPHEKNKNCHFPLKITEDIENFLTVIERYLKKGIWCCWIYEAKKRELLYLLRDTYSSNELASFFHPVLDKNAFFKESVLKNYLQARNVIELAELMRYSVSGLKKRFLKSFGMSAHKWMKQQKTAVVLKELKENKKSIKEVFISNRFASQAHFYEFCKKEFGKTPGEIRKEA